MPFCQGLLKHLDEGRIVGVEFPGHLVVVPVIGAHGAISDRSTVRVRIQRESEGTCADMVRRGTPLCPAVQ